MAEQLRALREMAGMVGAQYSDCPPDFEDRVEAFASFVGKGMKFGRVGGLAVEREAEAYALAREAALQGVHEAKPVVLLLGLVHAVFLHDVGGKAAEAIEQAKAVFDGAAGFNLGRGEEWELTEAERRQAGPIMQQLRDCMVRWSAPEPEPEPEPVLVPTEPEPEPEPWIAGRFQRSGSPGLRAPTASKTAKKRGSSLVGGKVLDLAAVYRGTVKGVAKRAASASLPPLSPPSISVVEYDEAAHTAATAGAGGTGTPCCVTVTMDDTLTAALCLISAGVTQSPFVLNFASPNMPGGAVASGVNAQEEALFRATDLHRHLNPKAPPRGVYPLRGQCVVSQGVSVARHPKSFEWLPEPWPQIDVATSAALQKPAVSSDGTNYSTTDGAEMWRRAAAVLQAAVSMGSTHLVLGAWGCGGFRNPAVGMARMFKSLLFGSNSKGQQCDSGGYARHFVYVEFAIVGEAHAAAFHAELFGSVAAPPPIGVAAA